MDVIALVGVSGTGKSHRAIMVAHSYEADLIIDDGLLIQGVSILGGISSKRQSTRLGAVKTALFTRDEHSEEARRIISSCQPNRILILATSARMAQAITRKLGLPEPSRCLTIEEIASPGEIQMALDIRAKYNKHVIPAPVAEVKKSLPGSLIDPIRVFLGKKDTDSKQRFCAEQSVVRPHFNYFGLFTISEVVIAQLAAHGVNQVYPASRCKIKQEQLSDAIVLNISTSVPYQVYIPDLLKAMQQRVKSEVEYYTGLYLKEVNLTASFINCEQA